MSSIFSSISFLKSLTAYWYQFALMFEALFILTTIDAGTRVARYVVQELGSHAYKPFGELKSLPANVIASLAVVIAWGYLVYVGSVQTIWPMFGTANQLLAMLALCLGTTIIIKMGKVKYMWVTLIPMIFMTVTTFSAAIELIGKFAAAAEVARDPFALWLNVVLLSMMVLLAVIILVDSGVRWYGYLAGKRPIVSHEVVH
jgi:carbon starvation protein